MFPRIHFFHIEFSTSLFLIGLTVLLSTLIFTLGLRGVALWRKLLVIFISTIAAFLGARLMHVFWEEPAYFREHPEMIFANLNGMVFYGGFFLGAVAVAITNWILVPKRLQGRAWDLATLCSCVGLVLLRVSCFSEGCCWGTPTALPWAVQYFNPEAVMPWLGIPVHPVQLYESAGAAIIGLLLWRLMLLKKYPGKLFFIFLPLYSLLRFGTEFFRGDSSRGEGVALGLSTSQFISFVILTGYLMFFIFKKFAFNSTKTKIKLVSLTLTLLFLSGCFLPKKPDSSVVQKVVKTAPAFEWNLMSREKKVYNPTAHNAPSFSTVSIPNTGRDAILVAVDDEVQKVFQKTIMDAYKSSTPLRLEEIMWWAYAPVFQKLYDRVLRVPYDQFTSANLFAAIDVMEREKRPYDIILMTHGVPNNLVTTSPEPYFSWEDLGSLKGKLKYAQVVFMQACFGDTLAPDWHAAGAKAVLSYNDFNRNFFYLPFFLENLKKKKWDVKLAQEKTLAEIGDDIRGNFLLKKVIEAMKMDVDTYLKNSPPPKLSLK